MAYYSDVAPSGRRVYPVDGMEIALVGLPKSGKTTLFNALTRGQVQVGTYGSTRAKLNVGVVSLPDPRLDTLAQMFKPKKLVPVENKFWDIPAGSDGVSGGTGVGGEFLNLLQSADALVHVVRAFEDPSVPHSQGIVDAHRDVETMNGELAFSDLAILERRMERLNASFKGAKGMERDALLGEQDLLNRVKDDLEGGSPLREQEFSAQEERVLSNYQFLTAKPLMLVFNVGENEVSGLEALEAQLAPRYQRQGVDVVGLCAQLEMELSQLSPEEEEEFRASLGVEQPGAQRVLQRSLSLLDLVSFFTVVSQEVRAWAVPRDTPALKAAGRIHSDMERGFIRAEVIGIEDLAMCGSTAEGKKRGLVRLEGKSYPVQDGDVITFLFNV